MGAGRRWREWVTGRGWEKDNLLEAGESRDGMCSVAHTEGKYIRFVFACQVIFAIYSYYDIYPLFIMT